ncbi:MAG TPA: ABC transporter substrate-binding protein [Dehalococcoidia bacterium]|nr:ABC transporter substrate-binding protein [Dehalococcoidia bacterium]
MSEGYWSGILKERRSRRTVLSATGSGVLAAALLSACGGSGESGVDTSLISRAVDTSKQAKRTGTIKASLGADVGNFDPHFTQITSHTPRIMAYNTLLGLKAGHLEEQDGSVEGYLAESWELSPDRLTLTLKLRTNAGFAPGPPANGRMMDASDVIYSWERFAKVGTNRALLANSANPEAPVLSMTAPDSHTVVAKLREPLAAVLSSFATPGLMIIPKDSETQVDLRTAQAGTGAFYRVAYEPSSRVVYKRNPNFFMKDVPLAETVELPIIAEYAAGLAQFRAGSIHTYAVRPEEVLSIKHDVPELSLYQAEMATPNVLAFFGWRATNPAKTPFRDVRVRQAFSMAWDRDLFIDVAYNVEEYRKQGLPVDTAWNTCLYCTAYKGWWIEPRSKEFGENRKFFEKNVAEAKKLLSAAGHANGLDIVSNHETGTGYGRDFPKQVEVLLGMTQEAGFRTTISPVGFNTNWVPEFRDAKGDFEGMAWRGIAAEVDVGNRLYDEFSAKGNRFSGFDPEGKGSFAGDPYVEDLLLKIRREFDDTKRKALATDVQRHFGKMMYIIRNPGGATGFALAWPALKNFNVFTGDPIPYSKYWIDESLPPLKRS